MKIRLNPLFSIISALVLLALFTALAEGARASGGTAASLFPVIVNDDSRTILTSTGGLPSSPPGFKVSLPFISGEEARTLQRADNIVVLKDGRVDAVGKLDDVPSSSEDIQRLWRGEIDVVKGEHAGVGAPSSTT